MIEKMYLPGSEWLYLKIYTGTRSAEKILAEIIKPFTEEILAKGVVKEYFFIRYTDPDFHIRLRLKLSSKDSFNAVFEALTTHFTEACQSGLIHKILIDTYLREIERYGEKTMVISEELFCKDSFSIVYLIAALRYTEAEADNDKNRWLLSMLLIDDMLTVFGYSLESKSEIMTRMSDNFCREFGATTPEYYKPLNNKYRENKTEINNIMGRKGLLYEEFSELLHQRVASMRPIANEMLEKEKTEKLEVQVVDLLPSFIHMTMNRVFRSNNRMCEMVVYHLLHKYYISVVQQNKKQ